VARKICLQSDRTVTARNQALDHVEQLKELGAGQASELHIVDLPLNGGTLRMIAIISPFDAQP
jgi:hypothetical protein